MSRETVELIRRALDAFNRVSASGDLTELVQMQREFADPAIEYTPVAEGTRICGYEDLLDYWRRWVEPWSEIRWDVEEVIDAGEQVLAAFTIVARGRAAAWRSRSASSWCSTSAMGSRASPGVPDAR